MVETATRLLHLLTLLQTRPGWTGAALAATLGVSGRTVRNDIERLRSLGYPIAGTRGEAGGYRLGAGTALPPLVLADEEAVAVALGLHLAATLPIAGLDAAAGTALTKLQQVLPARLRQQLTTLEAALPAPSPASASPHPSPDTASPDNAPDHASATIAPATMLAIATAIQERHVLRFDYQRHDGHRARREAEPLQLVFTRYRWYLVAWDRARDDWRTFRVDRLHPRVPPGPRFAPREPPPGGVVPFVVAAIHAGVMQFRATLRVFASANAIAPMMPPAVVVTPESDTSCLVAAGASTPFELAAVLARFEVEYEVLDSPALVAALRAIRDRYAQAIARSQSSMSAP